MLGMLAAFVKLLAKSFGKERFVHLSLEIVKTVNFIVGYLKVVIIVESLVDRRAEVRSICATFVDRHGRNSCSSIPSC